MLRSLAIAFVLAACSAPPKPASPAPPCPGPYAITLGTCAPVAPTTECRGVCGVVLRRRDCTPIAGATIVVVDATVAGGTDKTGRFEIPELATCACGGNCPN